MNNEENVACLPSKEEIAKRLENKLNSFTKEELVCLGNELSERSRRLSIPPTTQLELLLTQACNLRCDYCWIREDVSPGMSFDIAQRAVDLAVEQSRGGEFNILFFGGEPLLKYELIQQVILYAEQIMQQTGQKIVFSMTTNGTLLDEQKAKFFAEHKLQYLLSIDGSKATHDKHRRLSSGGSSFDRIAELFPMLKSYQPWIGARLTVVPDTVGDVCSNVRFLADMGINQFLIGSDADNINWDKVSLETFRDQLLMTARFIAEEKSKGRHLRIASFERKELERYCSVKPRNYFEGATFCEAASKLTVTDDGQIYPCSKFITTGGKNDDHPYLLGNVFDGVKNISAQLDLCDRRMSVRQKCLACELKDTCASQCPAMFYRLTGSVFHADDQLCNYAKLVYTPIVPELLALADAVEVASDQLRPT